MANLFLNVPSQAGNGSGAAVDFTTFGATKTIVVAGSWPETMQPTINIEINNDAAQLGTWAPIATFQGTGEKTVDVACMWIRVRVSNYRSGSAPEVDIGGTDAGTLFASLPVPAGNGVGASVDISALGLFKTAQIGNAFRGSLIIEFSEDGGAEWAQFIALSAPGSASKVAAANFARVRRVGVPQVAPGSPLVTLGACDVGGGGGIGGIDLEDEGVAVAGGPFTTLNFVGDGVTATDGGGGLADVTIPGNVMALPEQWVLEDIPANTADERLSAQVSTNFDTIIAIRDGSLVGLRTRLTGAIVAGNLTILVDINGLTTALAINHDSVTDPQGGVLTLDVGVVPYNAGDAIGIQYTTDAAFEPIASLAVEAWIEVFEEAS